MVKRGSTEIWTRIAGFKVQSANHYTIEPTDTQGWDSNNTQQTASLWNLLSENAAE